MFAVINRLTTKKSCPFVWYDEVINPYYSWKEKEMLDLYEEYIGELKVIEVEKDFVTGYYLKNINEKEVCNYAKEIREGIKELRNYKKDKRLSLFSWIYNYIDKDRMIIYIKIV